MKFAGAALLVPALLLDPTGRGAAAAAQRASGTLAVVGNGGRPARAYPLARCQGDCDGDDECQAGLKCFLREPGGPLPPGCPGRPRHAGGTVDNGNDFCYDPAAAEDADATAADEATADAAAAADDEKPPNLFADEASTEEDDGVDDEDGAPHLLAVVGNNGRPARAFPLAECQGDCDDDGECQVRASAAFVFRTRPEGDAAVLRWRRPVNVSWQ